MSGDKHKVEDEQTESNTFELAENLTKAHECLIDLDRRKDQIQEKLDRAEENICRLETKLKESELKVTRAQEEMMIRMMYTQLWQEIGELERRKRAAEKKLQRYRRRMNDRMSVVKRIALPVCRSSFRKRGLRRIGVS